MPIKHCVWAAPPPSAPLASPPHPGGPRAQGQRVSLLVAGERMHAQGAARIRGPVSQYLSNSLYALQGERLLTTYSFH